MGTRERVNICGISEYEFVDGKCNRCGLSVCDMDDSLLVEKRIYDYGLKHLLILEGTFNSRTFSIRLKERGLYPKAPKYIQKFVDTHE